MQAAQISAQLPSLKNAEKILVMVFGIFCWQKNEILSRLRLIYENDLIAAITYPSLMAPF